MGGLDALGRVAVPRRVREDTLKACAPRPVDKRRGQILLLRPHCSPRVLRPEGYVQQRPLVHRKGIRPVDRKPRKVAPDGQLTVGPTASERVFVALFFALQLPGVRFRQCVVVPLLPRQRFWLLLPAVFADAPGPFFREQRPIKNVKKRDLVFDMIQALHRSIGSPENS